MSNEIQVFSFNSAAVRTVLLNGEPWWIARDVCEILGIKQAGVALDRLDEDERGVTSIHTPGGLQDMGVVNESGLYSLILGSRKAEAKAFKKWITSEVLPSIRKQGFYTTQPAGDVALTGLNQLTELMKSYVPAIAGQITEIDRRVALVEDAQRKVDPKALADATAKEVIRRDMEVSRIKHEIRSGWIRRIVEVAKRNQGSMASEWDTFSKAWRKLHNFTGLNKFDDYRTPDVCRASISYLEGVLKALGGGHIDFAYGEDGNAA